MTKKRKEGPHATSPGTAAADERVESGIPRLDYILKGGFIRQGVYAVVGPPGSGKTIFGNQLCFNHARAGGRSVYLTLLTESHAKLVRNLRAMSFFADAWVGDRVRYISGYQALKRGGLQELLALMRAEIRTGAPTLFVVDGVEATEGFANDKQSRKEFLHELQSFTALAGCTTFLLSTTSQQEATSTENTLVDGVVELSDQLIGPRAVRELTVRKFRGSDYLRGRHEVEITSDGLQIHPRTEIQFDAPPERATEERVRMSLGVPTLDAMMDGGVPSGSALALLGAPGAGKTTLGLSFLVEGARRGQKGMYFGFYEPPPRLIEKAESLGLPLKNCVDAGMIELVWQPPLEHYMDSLAERLLDRVRAHGGSRRRLFIDGIEGFRAAAVYADRMPRFLSALTNQLRMNDVTTLISDELALFRPELDMPNPELANVVESVVLVRYVELKSQLYRLLSIMKMRESRYDTSIREFRITDRGIEVAGSFESAEAILSGAARLESSRVAKPQKAARGRKGGRR